MQTKSNSSVERGFTLIEVMISIAVMSIGILTLIAAFGAAITATSTSQEDLIARQKALEAMESIYTARNTQQITFNQIANISAGGIFTDGSTGMLSSGPDGLVNTADDVNFAASGVCPTGPECIPLPGPDGILGNADDQPMQLRNFTRQIQINTVLDVNGNLDTNLKQVVVTITYTRIGMTVPRTYTVNALISAYR